MCAYCHMQNRKLLVTNFNDRRTEVAIPLVDLGAIWLLATICHTLP